jgi:cell shape-determining protein MreC
MTLPFSVDSTFVSAIIGFLAGLLPNVYRWITKKDELRASTHLKLIDKLIEEGELLRKDLKQTIEDLEKDIESLEKDNENLKELNWTLKDKAHELNLHIRELEALVKKKPDDQPPL